MAAQFCRDETAAENVRRLLCGRLDKTLELLTHPPADQLPAAVHDARKSFKRLRALLRLVRPALGRKRFDKENTAFRDAGRALSPLRDAQVLVTAFDRLLEPTAARTRIDPDAALRLRSVLVQDLETVAQDARLPERVPAIVEELRAARVRLAADWPLEGGHWCHVGDGLRATYRQGRHALARLEDRPDTDASWHDLRKRVKDLGYQLRALRPLWPGALKSLGAELRNLAGALGDDHDLVVLRARLLDNPEPWISPKDLAALGAVIDARRAELQCRSLGLARRIYAEKPSAFEDRMRDLWDIWRDEKPAD